MANKVLGQHMYFWTMVIKTTTNYNIKRQKIYNLKNLTELTLKRKYSFFSSLEIRGLLYNLAMIIKFCICMVIIRYHYGKKTQYYI